VYLWVPDNGDPHLLPCCGYLLWRSTGLNTDSCSPPWGHHHDHQANSEDLHQQNQSTRRLVEVPIRNSLLRPNQFPSGLPAIRSRRVSTSKLCTESRLVLFPFRISSHQPPSCPCSGRPSHLAVVQVVSVWDSSLSQSRVVVSVFCVESSLHATAGGEHYKSQVDKRIMLPKKRLCSFHRDQSKVINCCTRVLRMKGQYLIFVPHAQASLH
jgi:hypothetical protein